ncbi:hypothetical protein PoB_004820900 [Plakobranchus ocellatus]|uniref:CCHC-type domain-containing protein n=1 Tax=Plakobranchus ocellatus TaxID=259542 RepID=A0AAV4BTL6_9GAST|nr:hypothetical protein PoB_004820900 [Plakobranchus ocellatus]
MVSVRPRESEKRVTGGQRAGEVKTSTSNEQSYLKCKRYGHIARDCTYLSPSAKKAGAEVIATARREGEEKIVQHAQVLLWK